MTVDPRSTSAPGFAVWAPRRAPAPAAVPVGRERVAALDAEARAAVGLAAERFGTPFYLYDFAALERRATALRAAAGDACEICYAVKANPALAVVTLLTRQGLGADVASRGELRLALAAGVPAGRIVMSGPAKSDADLDAALAAGVLGVNVEGERELERLDALAARRGRRARAHLRLGVAWSAGERRPILGGAGAAKFGMSRALAERLLAERRRFPHVDIRGLQVFNASNVLSAAAWVHQARRVLALALDLARRSGLTLDVVDLGGGLGIPYSTRERGCDLAALAAGLAGLGALRRTHPELARTRLLLEPGRFLVGPAGVYVARVVETKQAGEARIATLDGGVHHFLRPALLGAPHPVTLLAGDGRTLGRRREVWQLAGPLCTSLDTLDPAASIPPPRPGDLLVFAQAGAYGFTESMPLFLSHEWPAELGRRRMHVVSLRAAPTVDDLRCLERVPPELLAEGWQTGG